MYLHNKKIWKVSNKETDAMYEKRPWKELPKPDAGGPGPKLPPK